MSAPLIFCDLIEEQPKIYLRQAEHGNVELRLAAG